jgi:hypothetical protein
MFSLFFRHFYIQPDSTATVRSHIKYGQVLYSFCVRSSESEGIMERYVCRMSHLQNYWADVV